MPSAKVGGATVKRTRTARSYPPRTAGAGVGQATAPVTKRGVKYPAPTKDNSSSRTYTARTK